MTIFYTFIVKSSSLSKKNNFAKLLCCIILWLLYFANFWFIYCDNIFLCEIDIKFVVGHFKIIPQNSVISQIHLLLWNEWVFSDNIKHCHLMCQHLYLFKVRSIKEVISTWIHIFRFFLPVVLIRHFSYY